jgi:hypothetical protein
VNSTPLKPHRVVSLPRIELQESLRPALPSVYGPVDYKEWRDQLVCFDGFLVAGGLEAEFLQATLEAHAAEWDEASAADLVRFMRTARLALRANIARVITGLGFRDFSVRCADSPLLQWFLHLGEVERVKAPSKSSLARFAKQVPEAIMEKVHARLITLAISSGSASAAQPLGLAEAVDATEVFMDATCLKAHIHFPVDWVLLRDAARTLMKATVRIRREGLKQRMPQEPLRFLSDMNKLAMAMSAGVRRPDAKKQRKRTLRQMKALENKIVRHARAHRELLERHWEKTTLSRRQTDNLITCIEKVITQVPDAIHQAHERIIGGRAVPNAEKILSLYEPEVEILKRGKAGADVEFGNKLWLAELPCGLIVDFDLMAKAEVDSKLVQPSIRRLSGKHKLPLKTAWGDRGLQSKANDEALRKQGIASGLCPRDPHELSRRLEQEPEFRQGLRRRGGTEARIAILKNAILGAPCRAKGLAARRLAVSWAVLAHNLWLLARLKRAQESRNSRRQAA